MRNTSTGNVECIILFHVLFFFMLDINKIFCFNIHKNNIEQKYGNSGESLLGMHSDAKVKQHRSIKRQLVSRNKKAFQSTVIFPATWAIDTLPNTYSKTKKEDVPWWMIDLDVVVQSTKVGLNVPYSILFFSISYEVFLTMEKPKYPRYISNKKKCKMINYSSSIFTKKRHEFYECPLKGQFVTIKINAKQSVLILKEVDVYGEPLKYCTNSLNPCDEVTTECVPVNSPVYFGCKCKEGYTKNNNAYQTYCTKEEHMCDDIYFNPCEKYSTTCIKFSSPPFFQCKCKNGFIPTKEESGKRSKVRCMKENVCELSKCDGSTSICVNSQYYDSYECQCREGFKNELSSDDPETYTCVKTDHLCFTDYHTCDADTKCVPVDNFPDYECVTKRTP